MRWKSRIARYSRSSRTGGITIGKGRKDKWKRTNMETAGQKEKKKKGNEHMSNVKMHNIFVKK